MGPKMAAGGAVGAVLGGPGAWEALNWEFLVFLRETIGFSRSGEFSGGPGREGLAPFGALGGASGRSPDAFRSVGGARKGLRSPLGASGRSRELISKLPGRFSELVELIFGVLGQKLQPNPDRKKSLRHHGSRSFTMGET